MRYRHFLAAPAALLLTLACAAQPAPTAGVRRSGDAVVFEGRIDFASAARFLQLLEEPGVARVVVTSRGGLVAPALEMAQAIHRRGLPLEIPAACLSSCANYLFPAAARKVLGRADAVGWHGNMAHVLWLQQAGQASWSPDELAQARALARREAAFYRAIGVDGYVAWFGKLPPYAVDEFYYLSPQDLARFGIGDVTVRAPAVQPDPAVRLLSVDWPSLEAQRPAVRLDD
jgi:hypothetical protein